jgi:hypothetical protein
LITIVLASELKHSTESLLSGVVVPAACRDTADRGMTSSSHPDSPSSTVNAQSPSRLGSPEAEPGGGESADRYAFGRKVVICLLLTLVILVPAVAAILISKAGQTLIDAAKTLTEKVDTISLIKGIASQNEYFLQDLKIKTVFIDRFLVVFKVDCLCK